MATKTVASVVLTKFMVCCQCKKHADRNMAVFLLFSDSQGKTQTLRGVCVRCLWESSHVQLRTWRLWKEFKETQVRLYGWLLNYMPKIFNSNMSELVCNKITFSELFKSESDEVIMSTEYWHLCRPAQRLHWQS